MNHAMKAARRGLRYWTIRRRRRLTRALFLLAPLPLLAQMAMSMRGEEPFPAFMMPRFTYQTITAGEVVWEDVDIRVRFADGDGVSLHKHALFSAMHLPQRNKVLFRVFGTRTAAADLPPDPTVVRWLEDRVEALSGRSDACGIEFVWYEMIADFSTGEQRRPRRRITSYHFALQPRGTPPAPAFLRGSCGATPT